MESNDSTPFQNSDNSSGEQDSPIDRTQTWQLIFEQLVTAPDRDAYTQQLEQAAATMNCTTRTVQRHFNKWKEGNVNASQIHQFE